MPRYKAPVNDTMFVIREVLGAERYAQLSGFAGADLETIEAVLTEGARFCEEQVQPLNLSGDSQGCTRHADDSVTTPDGFKQAYAALVEGGWTTLSGPPEYGGQGLPHFVAMAFEEYLASANHSFSMYPLLSAGAATAIISVGTDEQRALYASRLISGEWTGTMNLTEPHCGTDLGLIRTRAEPRADGSYSITGTKIFISGGEHDLTSNIIHMVLAKTPGAPDNVKGISLFIVPKVLVGKDGALGERNAVSCGSIEHKMGIHANATCVMNYDGATGYLVGGENKGLAAMFIMMNAARMGVGVEGLSQAEVAYQNAADYARDRRQGRALTGPADPSAMADPIIVHPDVRRMLMEAKAFTEGARALCVWGGLLVDLSRHAETEAERTQADDLVQLLTPIIKGYVTDKGFETAVNAQQVFGGHGYIVEHGMDQFVRDARIPMIYEGTNGIQAMDLVGRKLAMNEGRAIRAFFALAGEEIVKAKEVPALSAYVARFEKAHGELQQATLWLMQNGATNLNNAAAAAYAYMHLAGIVALGLMWLRAASAAQAALDVGRGDKAFLEAKLVTARFFAERFMPDAGALRRKLEGGAEALMALPPEAFG